MLMIAHMIAPRRSICDDRSTRSFQGIFAAPAKWLRGAALVFRRRRATKRLHGTESGARRLGGAGSLPLHKTTPRLEIGARRGRQRQPAGLLQCDADHSDNGLRGVFLPTTSERGWSLLGIGGRDT